MTEGGRETWKEGWKGREREGGRHGREGDMERGRENLRQVRPEKATAMCKEYQRSPLLVQG